MRSVWPTIILDRRITMTNIYEVRAIAYILTMDQIQDCTTDYLMCGDIHNYHVFDAAWWYAFTFKFSKPYLFAWARCIYNIREANKQGVE